MNPTKVTKDVLLDILADIRTAIENDDSFEGSLEYSALHDECVEPGTFMVRGVYRYGNSQGQGFMSMVGDMSHDSNPTNSPDHDT